MNNKKHVIHRLYDSEMDFSYRKSGPALTYMLATIPRSGSTYFAIRLWQTGVLGAPMEYLNFRVIGNLFKRLGYEIDKFGYPPHEELDNYWSTIQQLRTSPNGVFGYKMFTSNYIEIARRATHLLKRLTPNYIIYLLRRDILGQAISYSRAQRSNNWFKGLSEINEKYDFNHIRSCILSIKNQRKCWEDIFNLTEVQPIRVFYEDILISESSVISLIADSIGAHFNKKNILPIPTIDKQRDSISKIWRQKFIDECRNDSELYNYVSQYNR